MGIFACVCCMGGGVGCVFISAPGRCASSRANSFYGEPLLTRRNSRQPVIRASVPPMCVTLVLRVCLLSISRGLYLSMDCRASNLFVLLFFDWQTKCPGLYGSLHFLIKRGTFGSSLRQSCTNLCFSTGFSR